MSDGGIELPDSRQEYASQPSHVCSEWTVSKDVCCRSRFYVSLIRQENCQWWHGIYLRYKTCKKKSYQRHFTDFRFLWCRPLPTIFWIVCKCLHKDSLRSHRGSLKYMPIQIFIFHEDSFSSYVAIFTGLLKLDLECRFKIHKIFLMINGKTFLLFTQDKFFSY